jgi:hypothetical protein
VADGSSYFKVSENLKVQISEKQKPCFAQNTYLCPSKIWLANLFAISYFSGVSGLGGESYEYCGMCKTGP